MEEATTSLEAVMAQLAAGDASGLVALVDGFRPQLAAAVRAVARSRHVDLRADAIDELVVEVALVIADLAPGWRSDGGAAPWVWARHQVAKVVDRHLGQFADPLDEPRWTDGASAPSGGTPSDEVMEVVARLAQRHHEIALLEEAVRAVASERDQVLFWETAMQQAMGDPSPATTVGGALGVTPAVVRQQHRRVRVRVQHLAATDPRYAVVGRLPLVA